MTGLLPDRFTFTQSNLQTYVNCKFQFYLRYIEHFLWPAPATNDMLAFERDRSAGSRFHQLVHQLLLGVPAEALERGAVNDPDARVHAWFQRFVNSIYQQLSGKLAPEYTLTASLNGFLLSAKYDLLQQDRGVYTIYDWKTSRKKPAKAWLEAQLQSKVFPLVLAYQPSISSDALTRTIRMVYWEVTEPGSPFVLEYGPEKLNECSAGLSALVFQIKANGTREFEKTEDVQRCRFCVYRSYCNRPVDPVDVEEWRSAEYLINEDEAELLHED